MKFDYTYQELLDSIPMLEVAAPTFLEIAGFPHYENVCSNILRFYLNPNNSNHGLNEILIVSLLKCSKQYDEPFNNYQGLAIKREMTTKTGRIDLVLYTDKWVVGIENKIFHWLNNDLNEYSNYLENNFYGRKILKIVLSISDESQNLSGGFINITYEKLFLQVEEELQKKPAEKTEYYIFFQHFIKSINKFYMNIQMDEQEINFLKNNQPKIDDLLELKNRMNLFISQRAKRIYEKVKVPDGMGKWIYGSYDVGFHYTYGIDEKRVQFKIECPLDIQGIKITICVEQNKIDKGELERLNYFKKNKIESFDTANNRVILEPNIPFSIDDNDLAKKIETILSEIKISE